MKRKLKIGDSVKWLVSSGFCTLQYTGTIVRLTQRRALIETSDMKADGFRKTQTFWESRKYLQHV